MALQTGWTESEQVYVEIQDFSPQSIPSATPTAVLFWVKASGTNGAISAVNATAGGSTVAATATATAVDPDKGQEYTATITIPTAGDAPVDVVVTATPNPNSDTHDKRFYITAT